MNVSKMQQMQIAVSVYFGQMLTLTQFPFGSIWFMNRNAREPKKANAGKRPCSNVRRRRALRARATDVSFGVPTKKKKGVDY
jgi:hypothetical protein